MTPSDKSETVTIVLKRDIAEYWLEFSDLLAAFMIAVGQTGGIRWKRNGAGEIEVAIREALER